MKLKNIIKHLTPLSTGEGLGVRPLGVRLFPKILCLALGLAVSAVIIAEVCYEQTYDQWFDGWERTYLVTEEYTQGGAETSYTQTPGGLAPAIKRYSPQVEAATRTTSFLANGRVRIDDKPLSFSGFIIGDSCLFDVFPRPIIVGDAKEALARPRQCMVSRSLAERLGGDILGKRLVAEAYPTFGLTVCGVYDDFPWGSSLHGTDVVMSMRSQECFAYDGSNNMVGNDRYRSFVRLAKGHDVGELRPCVERMCRDLLPHDELRKAGVTLSFDFTLLSDLYTHDPYIRMMAWVLSIVAMVLLTACVMNYLLITIGDVAARSKAMAVRRCYGAGAADVHAIVLGEALLHVVLAVAVASLLVYACKGTIEQVISAPLSALFTGRGSWLLAAILAAIVVIGGVVPGMVYLRIPVTAAFRGHTRSRHRWKVALLSVQFVVSALLFTMLYVVGGQYATMVGSDPGYDYKRLAFFHVEGATAGDYDKALAELKRMPEVASVTTASTIPLAGYSMSGNNVGLAGDERELFNALDMYYVTNGYFETMGMRITQGSFFTEQTDSCRQLMVSEAFAKRLATAAGWKDGVVGKRIWVSEHCDSLHPTLTVCGVFSDIKAGDYTADNEAMNSRPMMYFYRQSLAQYVIVRFHEPSVEALEAVRVETETLFPGKEVALASYPAAYDAQYVAQLNFRNAVMVGGAVTLAIALFGLVGYSIDEVNRRRKEIAIRKVNGARVADVMRLLMGGIVRVALPSVVVGQVAAWLVARQWQLSFTVKFSVAWWALVAIALALLAVIAAAMAANCYKVANANPVKYLKDE